MPGSRRKAPRSRYETGVSGLDNGVHLKDTVQLRVVFAASVFTSISR
jgi:hypothetical protein